MTIKEGEMFLLPARILHSPQRPADTLGLVFERHRQQGEVEDFMWFCEQCDTKLHEESLHLVDVVSQLPPLMERFYSSLELRTCGQCGAAMEPPAGPS